MFTQAKQPGAITTSVQDSPDPKTDLSLLAKLGELGKTPIDSSRLRYSIQCKSLKSAILNPDLLLAKLEKEVELGGLLGPFINKPFSNLRVNSVGLVPKSSGGMRLITHLSCPCGNSVDYFINERFSSVCYSKFDNVTNIIQQLGPGAFMGKRDVKISLQYVPRSS